MKFLMEHELAFDTTELGFPSIQGCHAIVYQTSAGLYGFHVAGGSADGDWDANAKLLEDFVAVLGGLAHPGTRLYGSSFVGNNQRGYSGAPAAKWKQELVMFASKLAYTGRISGYDLSRRFGGTDSAYVEYRVNGEKCDLHVRKWNRASEHPGRVTNPDRTNHQAKFRPSKSIPPTLQALVNVVPDVDRTGLAHVHKQCLR